MKLVNFYAVVNHDKKFTYLCRENSIDVSYIKIMVRC